MEESTELAQLRQITEEAIEMLEDARHKLALFERQRYGTLKAKIEKYNSLSYASKLNLSFIKPTN